MTEQIVLLNADFTFLNVVSWKKALTLVAKGKVQVLEYGQKVITGTKESVLVPIVMRLIKLIRTIYKNKVPFSKKNVMIRDDFKCAYCGSFSNSLTMDHVKPKSKGGKSSFENCVTACKPCNNKKGNKSCHEVNMFPKTSMVAPTISEFLRLKIKSLGVDKVLDDLWNKI